MKNAPLTIPQALERAVADFGNLTAIEDGPVVLSFAELSQRARESCRAAMAAGLRPGQRAAIQAPNLWEWVIAALGIQLAGGVLVPINTRYKGVETRFVLERSRATLLFTVQGFLNNDYVSRLREVGAPPTLEKIVILRGSVPDGCQAWSEYLAAGADYRQAPPRVAPEDLSDLLFTSGTTGAPKGVMTTHSQNCRAFWSWTEVIGLQAGDRYLLVNPFFHAFGYKAGWLACILRGATILPHPVFNVDDVVRRIPEDRVSMLPGPPALFQSLLAHPGLPEADLASLRLAVTGAASIPVSLIEQMRDRLGFDTVITGYGLTEACGIATMCRFDDDPHTIATTSGRAIEGVEVRCVDASGAPVDAGQPGEVVVRGYNVMRGYFEDEDQTASTIDSDGWLHTGDIGVLDDRGYLRITDRKKDMFIMGGFNCYPAEIENLMSAHADIVQVAVIGVPDERMGEIGMAFVVRLHGSTLTETGLVAWCRDRMANFKVPRKVQFVDALPMNATGKVQKFMLRDGVAASSEGA